MKRAFSTLNSNPSCVKVLDTYQLAEGMPYGSRDVAGQCKHYAYSTEKIYVYWTKRFVL